MFMLWSVQNVCACWKLKEQEQNKMSKASENVALKIKNVFVQEDIFNGVLNAPAIPTHFPAVWIIKVKTILISSLEFGDIDKYIGLKTVLLCRTFSLLTFITSML